MFTSINPATGERAEPIPEFTADEIELALSRATTGTRSRRG